MIYVGQRKYLPESQMGEVTLETTKIPRQNHQNNSFRYNISPLGQNISKNNVEWVNFFYK